MKVAAVICELNPFHNGHALLFRKLREEYGADYIIAVMSGNYVQRGEPAVFDKYIRAEMALRGDGTACGPQPGGHADLVLELPPLFAASSAKEFAAAGVRLAVAAGVADILGFGIEAPATLDTLQNYAVRLSSADREQNAELQQLLSGGLSYPAALSALLGADALTPNNILAVEYLRTLAELGQPVSAAAVLRQGDGYHETNITDHDLASASALRERIFRYRDPGKADRFPYSAVPKNLHPFYRSHLDEYSCVHPDALSSLLAEHLVLAAEDPENDLSLFLDVSSEIAGRLCARAYYPMSYTERITDTKTRQYTYSRISRALLHIALGMTRAEFEERKATGYIRYLRVLGFRRGADPILHAIKEQASVPLITKPADHKELLQRDLHFDQIYYSLQTARSGSAGIRGELERSPVIVD